MRTPAPPTWLSAAAWANAATHVVASAAMLWVIAPGVPDGSRTLQARMAYVQGHSGAWTVAWLTWHPAALALVATVIGLLVFARGRGVGRRRWAWHAAIATLGCGVVSDLTGQWVYVLAAGDVSPMRFSALEGWAGDLTGLVANGLYTASVALVHWTCWGGLPPAIRATVGVVTVAGLSLSAASLVPWPPGQMAATALLMPTVIVWSYLVARWAKGS